MGVGRTGSVAGLVTGWWAGGAEVTTPESEVRCPDLDSYEDPRDAGALAFFRFLRSLHRFSEGGFTEEPSCLTPPVQVAGVEGSKGAEGGGAEGAEEGEL